MAARGSFDFEEFCRENNLTGETAEVFTELGYDDPGKLRTLTADDIHSTLEGKATDGQISSWVKAVRELKKCPILRREPIGHDVAVDDMIRVILVGKTGTGKSSTGNSIVGDQTFTVKPGFASDTFSAAAKTAKVSLGGKKLYVLDTPGLTDTTKSLEEIALFIVQSMVLCIPGPHVLLVTIKYDRYTENEYRVYESLKQIFGDGVCKHIIIVFTAAKREQRLKDPLQEVREKKNPANLLTILAEVENRCIFLDNSESDRDLIISELLTMITTLSERPPCYFCKGKMAEVNQKAEQEIAKIAKKDQLDPKDAKVAKEDRHDPKDAKVAKEDRHDPKDAKVAKDDQHDPKDAKVAKEDRHDPKDAKVAKEDQHDPKDAKIKFLKEVEDNVNRVTKIEAAVAMHKLLRRIAVPCATAGAVGFAVGGAHGAAAGAVVGGAGGALYDLGTRYDVCSIS